MKSERADIYTKVTNQIIAALEKGCGKWRMPWHCETGLVMPRNALTRTQYRGVNVAMLWCTAEERGYVNPLWATYKQWEELGAQVRKGEKSCPVVFWGSAEKKARNEGGEGEESDTFLFAHCYSVFNVAQVDGYAPELCKDTAGERSEDAETFFERLKVTTRENSKAFYRPSEDAVYMPPFTSFYEPEGYYAVLAHEVTHWTGHESRLNRDLSGRFGSDSYAVEELVAELGAAFVCAALGISNEPREDHAPYVENWLNVLRNDKRAFFAAASKAQQAADFMNSAQGK